MMLIYREYQAYKVAFSCPGGQQLAFSQCSHICISHEHCLLIRCQPSSSKPLPPMCQYSWLEDGAVSVFQFACSLKGINTLILSKQRKKCCSFPSISATDHQHLKFSDMFKPQGSGNLIQSGFQEIGSDSLRPFALQQCIFFLQEILPLQS